ncbi:MAG: hypothetical protein GYB68_07490 [Chloroflexi bacterium]|nr:hypothetical protein [Chloroflexota bacterium]
MTDKDTNKRIADLHQQAVIIDGHCDILIPITQGKMDLNERVEVPDPAEWLPPPGLERTPLVQFGMPPHTIYFGPMGQYDIPRWKDGDLSGQLCAVYLDDEQLSDPLRNGLEMVWQLHDQINKHDDLVLCTTASEIRQAKADGKIGLVLTFEGCEALGPDPHFIDIYYQLGLRSASLTHTRRNIYADGCWAADKQGGLTALGKRLIQRMLNLNIVIDLVHIGQVGYWEILEMATVPVILSHSTPTMFPSTDASRPALLDGKLPRPQLELPRDREMLEALAHNGGVLGLIWIGHEDVDHVVNDIETALEVMGPDHIGLGSDHYGLELAPEGLEDISKVGAITRALVERGHSDEVILQFLGGNYLRVFELVWGA